MESISDHQEDNIAATTEATKSEQAIEQEACNIANAKQKLSIYDTLGESKRKIILFIISIAGFLSVFDELIYVPALPAMIKDFKTTETLGFFTIGVYLFGSSLSSLIWGSLSDYYGRKPIITFGLFFLTLSSTGCYFSPNIYVFLVFRSLQGFLVSVTVVVGLGTLSDIYRPDDRGSAYGIFYAFFSLAAFGAPVIGGQISEHYSWRAIFLLVTIISFVLLLTYVLIVPETQQFKVICAYQNRKGITLLESSQVSKPIITDMYLPLLYFGDLSIFPYVLVLVSGYLASNCDPALLSIELSKPPYSYHANTVGMLFMPLAVIYLAASIVGGKLSDLVAVKSFEISKILEGRMIPGIILSILVPVGLTTYGWAAQYGMNISVLIIAQMLFLVGHAAVRPGILSYLTIKHQNNAGSINSYINFAQGIVTSVVLTSIGRLLNTVHDGPTFTILAIFNLLSTVIAGAVIYKKFISSRNSETQLLL